MSYKLTREDVTWGVEESAAIRAAGNPNPAVLRALLDYHKRKLRELAGCSPNANISGGNMGTYESPLTAAIRVNSSENVRTLLARGADPTGIHIWDLSDYSARFMRGRDAKVDVSSFGPCPSRLHILEVAKSKGITEQTQPLTQAELDERRTSFPRFWTEPNVPGQRLRMNKGITALEVAAGLGFEDLFALVREAGADGSAWISASGQANFDDTKPSSLSITSPIHEAIEHGQHAMLERLLNTYRYSPNYRAMAAPTVAFPPLSFALGRCDPNDPNIRACIKHLLAHPDIDLNLRTPIFEIHPLHLAVARHDPELLSFLPMPLSSAGTTALGHTLLHIASLPLTSMSMNREIPDAVRSVHCARTLDSQWLPHSQPSPLHLETTKGVAIEVPFTPIDPPTPLTPAEQDAQLSTLRVLADARIDVRAQDVDGNTALHYLSTALNGDPRAMQLLREMEGGEEVYNSCKNREDLTPRALWEACNAS
ncbi:uncharacterized protein N7446_002459 [Penicillium canescens]|uniref:Ankyrin n=1 Tax=Penicillium canescens TaxID=5083 RepID=A0AAD6N9S1_PENCN|nr:uncharacterized protein N7446_002459 [Penicillium canescens]KAJ6044262.1 hypothetical protein N7460_005617 [Penicillium canescens]KAJ6055732.1 hypothetical protein N7444_004830 [Penicillium canescens]KAJ6074682.1 hypothetical protein N7446_002459 [Penicillium canescens]